MGNIFDEIWIVEVGRRVFLGERLVFLISELEKSMLCPNTERKYRRKIGVADALCPGEKWYKLMLERGKDDAVIFFSHGIFFPLVNNYEGREEILTLLTQTPSTFSFIFRGKSWVSTRITQWLGLMMGSTYCALLTSLKLTFLISKGKVWRKATQKVLCTMTHRRMHPKILLLPRGWSIPVWASPRWASHLDEKYADRLEHWAELIKKKLNRMDSKICP